MFLAALTAQACLTPVFRYALERWKPSVYPLLVFHRGPLTAQQEAVIHSLRQVGETQRLANVAVRLVDLSQPLPPGVEAVWRSQTNAALPWMVLRYPDTEAEAGSAWAGALTAEHAQQLVDSPLRRAIAQGLADGHAAVWVLLESGDAGADNRAAEVLETVLKKAHRTIELPADPDSEETNAVQLKVTFKLVRSPRQAPAEEVFLHTLLAVEEELAARQTPIVVPVFGRGRALCALPGRQITPDVLREAIDFLTGACSCEVKEMNPGLDLLMTANWEDAIAGKRLSDHPPPALIGLGGLIEKPEPPPPADALVKTAPAAATDPTPPAGSPMARSLWWFGAGLAGLLAAATWFVTRKRE